MFILIARLGVLASIFLFAAHAGNAQSLPRAAFDDMVKTKTAVIHSIIDPITVQTEDGDIVRLSGVHIPDLEVTTSGDIAVTAREIMDDLLKEQRVHIYQTPKSDWGRSNRMGHQLAHIARIDTGAWAQGTLLRLGLAYTLTNERTPEMADQMYALEGIARDDKIGLWGLDEYAVASPADLNDQTPQGYKIIEGTVKAVAVNKGKTFINFGDDWRTDFTAMIPKEYKKIFTAAGIDPGAYNGKTMRVRGWVRQYNGPFMEITHPHAIEVLD